MSLLSTTLAGVIALASAVTLAAEPAPKRCYELRTYYAVEGKLDELHARCRNHVLALFERHGITSVAYWTPQPNPENQLVYLVSYPDRAARDAAWEAFNADPERLKVKQESEVNGPLVKKSVSQFLELTDFSPEIKLEGGGHTFEMRTYTATPGNLAALHKRFREHTIGLFTKHGMRHFGYFTLSAGQPGAEDTLLYFLVHASPEAAKQSFDAFRADPVWVAAKEASEKAAGGSLTVPAGVKSVMLTPIDYSPAK